MRQGEMRVGFQLGFRTNGGLYLCYSLSLPPGLLLELFNIRETLHTRRTK